MSGEVCQRRATDSTGQAAEKCWSKHRRYRDGEAKLVAQASEGRETIDMNGERGKGERNGQKYTFNITTSNNQRRSSKMRGQPDDGIIIGGR